jgi:serine/threonine-protein kinase
VSDSASELPTFGRFRATSELGVGAMGTVYRAHDDVLGRAVAIKTLHSHSDTAIRERFLREARAIGTIHHPHILAVHDAGTEGNTPYLVMELCAGGSLRERIEVAPLAVDAVRQIGIQIAGALAAAHAANVLHRDVKPANILCTETGAWKLADFGIARLPDSKLTITGQFLGSPSYAAPESLRAGVFTPASDVYALGATLYEALTGSPPHGRHDLESLIRKLEQDPTPLRDKVKVGDAIDAAIMRSLAKDPAQRPTAAQLAELLATDHVPARRAWPRTRTFVIGAIALAIVLAIVLHGHDTPPPASVDGTPPVEHADDPNRPQVLDQNGNPVDDETAKRVLDQLDREDHDRPEDRDHDPPHGPGHKKHKDHPRPGDE